MVNYPHKVSSQKRQTSLSQPKNFANRGMSFEKMINATNDYYLSQGLAVIHKKPTPIQIVRVDYPQRSRAKIVEAYFRQASTTDYSGVYNGYYIDFEVKETKQKRAIPMKNFHPHQIQHMEQVLAQQGICFVLLHFSSQQETYLLPAFDLIRFYHQDKGQKSMPLEYIREYGYEI
ncbi:Holliday junction resolvase RecU, partial [Streptococcus pneumoniae]|uniref:Holliday junction resolvase RecU n=1 Tax=Streptococcus pneumoniae TaxID=1313 RepID=UPI000775EA6C